MSGDSFQKSAKLFLPFLTYRSDSAFNHFLRDCKILFWENLLVSCVTHLKKFLLLSWRVFSLIAFANTAIDGYGQLYLFPLLMLYQPFSSLFFLVTFLQNCILQSWASVEIYSKTASWQIFLSRSTRLARLTNFSVLTNLFWNRQQLETAVYILQDVYLNT